MAEIWFEDELTPASGTVEEITKALTGGAGALLRGADDVRTEITEQARARVRAHTPDWARLADTSKFLTSGRASSFYQVRLGVEFELAKEARAAGGRFTFGRCAARLWSAASSQAQPRVYDLFPRDLYEGEPTTVTLEFGPEIKVGAVGGSLGKISTDIRIGQVEPVVVGWKGEGEREPYWDLNPQSKSLLGPRHFWLLLEVPNECNGARLALLVEGDVETRFGPIPIAPKERAWENRPSVLIR